jgi:hypothetical protein
MSGPWQSENLRPRIPRSKRHTDDGGRVEHGAASGRQALFPITVIIRSGRTPDGRPFHASVASRSGSANATAATGRVANGTQHTTATGAALAHPVSRMWAGYWQRAIKA